MTRKVRVHAYVADPAMPADHRGDRPCLCGVAKGNERHDLPQQPAEVTEAEARRLGERDG